MLAAAFITSSLAERIKKQAAQSAKTAYRTQILFDTNQQLSNEQDIEGIISVTCGTVEEIIKKRYQSFIKQQKISWTSRCFSLFRKEKQRQNIGRRKKEALPNGRLITINMRGQAQRHIRMPNVSIYLCVWDKACSAFGNCYGRMAFRQL